MDNAPVPGLDYKVFDRKFFICNNCVIGVKKIMEMK